MSVNNQNNNLKTDIKNFIDLLQNSDKFPSKQRKISYDSGGLSIIYSASQPETSLADRSSSSHHSGELSNNSKQQINLYEYFKEIKKYGLSAQQSKTLEKIELYIFQMHQSIAKYQQKLKLLQRQFEQQRKITDQVLKALMKMESNQHQRLKNFQNLQKKYIKIQQDCENMRQINQILQKKITQSNNDLEFMKKLVLVANQNYEKLQKKCQILERKQQQNQKQQRSSTDITSRSTITHKKSPFSPSISQRVNISPHHGQFDEHYRKHLVRTLKNRIVR